MKKKILKLNYVLLCIMLLLVGFKTNAQVNLSFPEVLFTDVNTIARGNSSTKIMNRLIALVDNTPAGQSVYLSIYMINYQPLMDALKNAETRGVDLHLIVDMSRSDPQVTNATSLPWLQSNLTNSEIVVTTSDISANSINHHKHALFSGVSTTTGLATNVTFQTSHNFTTSDMGKIQDALIFNDADIYNAFLSNWNIMKQNASSGMKANFNYTTHNLGANTKLTFFPRITSGVYDGEDDIVENLNAITDVANAKIRIAMSDWSDSRPAIVDKLIQLRNQGATIEVFVKDAAGTQTKTKLRQLATLGATVRIFNLEGGGDAKFNIHAKMMLLEGNWNGITNAKVILTGSHNYTDGALKTNNEVLVTLVNSTVYPQYIAYFDELKSVIPTVQLLAWNFNTLNTTGNEITNSSTFTSGGLFSGTVKRGDGFRVSGLSKGMGSARVNTDLVTTRANAISRNEYFEFKIVPKPGRSVTLSQIEYAIRRSSTAGPSTGAWAYVVEENGNSTILDFITPDFSFRHEGANTSANIALGWQQTPIDLTQVEAFKNIGHGKTVSLRLYAWGGTTTGATLGLGPYSVNNSNSVVLHGDVDQVLDSKLILGWSANEASGELATITSTLTAKAVNPSTIVRGAGLEASSLSRGFSARTNANLNFLDVTDQASAVANNSYLEFSLHVKAGSQVSLETIYAKFRRSGAGAKKYAWSYSVDNAAFEPITISPVSFTNSATSGIQQEPIDLKQIAALQNITNAKVIKFRLYSWEYTSAAGSFALGLSETSSDDVLTITGTTIVTPLPVTLTSFDAKKTNNAVNLTWETASENNNSHFDVLKSVDGKNWQLLTTVLGNANSNKTVKYHSIDHRPAFGANYYQLKQVDFDGTFSLSKIEAVNFSLDTKESLKVNYIENTLKLFVNKTLAEQAEIAIYSVDGRKISAKTTFINIGSTVISLPAALARGVYLVKVKSLGGELVEKFIAN